jgi:thiol:disulfide interchange protein DsbC
MMKLSEKVDTQMMKKMNLALVCCAMTMLLTAAGAQTDQEESIKKLVEPKLGKGVVVDSIKKTPYAGLYELQVDGDIYYTDEKAQYLFVGNVMDLSNHKNLTKARIDGLSEVKFSDLPLDLAFKQVKGDGSRVIAVFEDPTCGYCKRLRKALQNVDNITIYTFMYDILSDESQVKSRNVWCSKDPARTWTDWMVNGIPAPTAPDSCTSNPHEKIMALGEKLRIHGTPALFFTDGTRIPGFVDAAALEEKLKTVK